MMIFLIHVSSVVREESDVRSAGQWGPANKTRRKGGLTKIEIRQASYCKSRLWTDVGTVINWRLSEMVLPSVDEGRCRDI